jgi:hypothetical protein
VNTDYGHKNVFFHCLFARFQFQEKQEKSLKCGDFEEKDIKMVNLLKKDEMGGLRQLQMLQLH